MKTFSQKGQGLVEYALLFGFIGAIFLFVFTHGGLISLVRRTRLRAELLLTTRHRQAEMIPRRLHRVIKL